MDRQGNTSGYALLLALWFPFKRLVEILASIDISERATIGEGPYIAHIGSIVIGHDAIIGRNASVHQGVTIGASGGGGKFPILGDRVYLGAGAKILGPVRIGSDVVVGANAVVTRDVPDKAVVAGAPANVLNYKGSSGFIHFRSK